MNSFYVTAMSRYVMNLIQLKLLECTITYSNATTGVLQTIAVPLLPTLMLRLKQTFLLLFQAASLSLSLPAVRRGLGGNVQRHERTD
jgi:hypothetical protein